MAHVMEHINESEKKMEKNNELNELRLRELVLSSLLSFSLLHSRMVVAWGLWRLRIYMYINLK